MAPERMEVELFGVEGEASESEGARMIGTFERAHGGTLFLDEVADMPLETQAKILRVLIDQVFIRVGGTQHVQVDIRVVTGSSRDLKAEIAAGNLREDLYHRLNVVPIRVPALKERREDIPALVNHFMQNIALNTGLSTRQISEDAMAALQGNEWPGNVRELRNAVERLLIMAPGDENTVIGAEMLPPDLGAPTFATFRPNGGDEIMAMPLRQAREQFEREYLLAQIARFAGNISRTASFIGMERSALHRKLKSLGVSGSDKHSNAGA
jgi:two-component system nitrogen regulation response regulator NtrX